MVDDVVRQRHGDQGLAQTVDEPLTVALLLLERVGPVRPRWGEGRIGLRLRKRKEQPKVSMVAAGGKGGTTRAAPTFLFFF